MRGGTSQQSFITNFLFASGAYTVAIELHAGFLCRAVDKFFSLGVLNLAAKGSPAGSVATGIPRGVRGHAPPENFEILGCLRRILEQFETVKDIKKILYKSSKNMTSC